MTFGCVGNIEVLRLYFGISLLRCGPVLSLLDSTRTHKVYWLRYRSSDPVSPGYEFTTRQVFDVPPLRPNKRLNTDSFTVVFVPGRESRLVSDVHSASVDTCKAEWRELSGVAESMNRREKGLRSRRCWKTPSCCSKETPDELKISRPLALSSSKSDGLCAASFLC